MEERRRASLTSSRILLSSGLDHGLVFTAALVLSMSFFCCRESSIECEVVC